MSKSTFYNMQSVSSNAVYNALGDAIGFSDTERKAGLYFGKQLYTRTVHFSLEGTTNGQTVNYNLPSEFNNYYIVRINGSLSRDNFTVSASSCTFISAWTSNRTTLNFMQTISNYTRGMDAFVDLYYVKS